MRLTASSIFLPNLQIIFDPANNPTEDSIWIIGLRARLDI
jgi:hypothetical protein